MSTEAGRLRLHSIAYGNLAILRDARWFDAHRLGTAVMPKADRAVFDIPVRVHFATCFTH